MNTLPFDCITVVFKTLDTASREALRATCKKYYKRLRYAMARELCTNWQALTHGHLEFDVSFPFYRKPVRVVCERDQIANRHIIRTYVYYGSYWVSCVNNQVIRHNDPRPLVTSETFNFSVVNGQAVIVFSNKCEPDCGLDQAVAAGIESAIAECVAGIGRLPYKRQTLMIVDLLEYILMQ